MTDKLFPERLYETGFTDLVSVIPPGAQLTPSSKIPQAQIGKIPGRRLPNGLWVGYNWRKEHATAEDVRRWGVDAANVGLRADRFPGVDIDCKDAALVEQIRTRALEVLGAAPLRIGRAPKALLMYRAAEPFGRMRLWLKKPNGVTDLVEILGEGQQYLVHGTHPNTGLPYVWEQDPTAFPLTTITGAQASAFLDVLQAEMSLFYQVEREGDGRRASTLTVDQAGLLAPSIEVLHEAVALIPNNSSLFPTRTDYLKFGYAIKAACGAENDDAGLEAFADWAARWNDGFNDPETVLADWRRMNGSRKVGWNWLAELARGYGFNDAQLDFTAIEATPDTTEPTPINDSEQWLAAKLIERYRNILRYVPQKGCWLVWETARWRIDAELQAEDIIKRGLRDLADEIARRGATPKEKKDALDAARGVCSAAKLRNVLQLIRSDRAIAVSMEALDHDPWTLNTPAGLVDLRSGAVSPPNPDALCSKIAAVPPDFTSNCPEWKRFLAEATDNDAQLSAYLQRLCGYALTGDVREQHLTFIWGGGGNGKSVFLNVLSGVMGDYARIASMDTFTASNSEKHSTDIAMLVGARLVTASETEAGKRWDEQRVKSMSGGEPVSARFMRQDNFTFTPQFKLVFIGNHRPEIRDVGKSMRRRIQMVPFNVTPKRVDLMLGAKLREEWPAILAWMVEGALAWQQQGLNPPLAVRMATDDYFDTEDAIGRWQKECTELDDDAKSTTAELFQSWTEWANRNNEYRGSMKRFAEQLKSRKLARWQDPATRRMGFVGLKIADRQDVLMNL